MTVLDRKLRRELFAARGVLVAVVGIIVVGIACFVAMASAYQNLKQSRDRYYAQCRMADFSIEVKKAPVTELKELSKIAGISELQARIQFEVSVDLDGVEKPLSGRVISLPAHPRRVINDIILQRGSYFTEGLREEVIVNDGFATARNIHPGDRIHLILNNRRQQLLVVGTALSSEFVYLLGPGSIIPDRENYGVFYVKESFAEEAFDFEGAFNQVVGLLDPAYREAGESVLMQAEDKLKPYGVFSTTPRARQPSHWFLSEEIYGLRVTVAILPTLFLSVAALILNVLMTRMAQQQRTIIGTLKALGYSDLKLFAHFVKFGAAIGLFGGMIGTLAGYFMAGGMMRIYKRFYEFPELINRPHPEILAAGVAMSMAFAIVGSLRGVRAVLRLSPAEAMRPKPPVYGRRIVLERVPWLWRKLGFRWQMVLRGIVRNRMRTLAGMFAAAVGAALMIVSFYSRDATHEIVEQQFERILLSDVDLAFKDERNYSCVFEALHLPYVDYAEPVFNVACTFHNGYLSQKGAITGILHDSRLTVPRDAMGNRVSLPATGLLLTRKLAEILAVSEGESITFTPVKGLRDARPVRVAAIVDSYLGLAAYADFHWLNHLVGEEASVTTLQLKVAPGAGHLSTFYREVKNVPTIEAVNAIRDQKHKLVRVLVEQLTIMLAVIIGFAGVIFFGSILNSSLISLAERQHEIATFRALGYGPGEVGGIFLRESLCVNVAGTLAGFPLGYWLSKGACDMQNTELFRVPFVIHPSSWLLALGLGLAFTLLAHVPVQWAMNKLDWLPALNVRE